MHIRLIAAAAVIALAGCAAQNQEVWLRNGQRVTGEAALAQGKLDQEACIGEAQKARLSAGGNYQRGLIAQIGEEVDRSRMAKDVVLGCMAGKGYSHAPELPS